MSQSPYNSPVATGPSVTLQTIRKMKQDKQKIVMITAYDASFAAMADHCGADIILVGDSLGMVVQGHDSTVPVTMNDMIYHTRMVARGRKRALIMGDMPFMSYANINDAIRNATRFMQEGGAHMVKLEGGGNVTQVVQALADCNIPVCAHLGLQPQSVHKIGGYKVQGRDPAAAEAMVKEAHAMQEAGADMLLLECVPAPLASRISQSLTIPTIGIGAGAACDGQVLVIYDVLGISTGRKPKFAKNFLAALAGQQDVSIQAAIRGYVDAVRTGQFPATDHIFES